MTLLELKNISKTFISRQGILGKAYQVQALKDVSFKVDQGEIVSIVGESGSGKSTLIKIIQGILNADSGEILINNQDVKNLNRIQKAKMVQTIFQDPYASLNPKLSIRTILQEAMRDTSQEKLEHLLNQVGLDKNALPLYPHQFSGGQRQRIGIARCLAAQPQIILADEPVSALDVSIQAQILNLMMNLNEKGITFLLITHDLSIVKHLSDRVIILDQGQIVEQNLTHHIFDSPQNLATQKLFNAIPKL